MRIEVVYLVFIILVVVSKPWIYEFSPLVTISSSISRLRAAKATDSVNQVIYSPSPSPSKINCFKSYGPYDLCSISSPTVLDPKVATFYVMGPTKRQNVKMVQIRNVTLTSGPPSPPCMVQHNSTALLFSATGNLCTGNFFHAFNDGLIPLFITVDLVFPRDRDWVLVISSSCDRWVRKYADLLQSFSKHRIITLTDETATHCFPSAVVGPVSHGFMTIDPKRMRNSKTLMHFHALLEKVYGRQNYLPPNPNSATKPRPRLVLASRSGNVGREILNQAELMQVAEEEGFEVIEFEPKFDTPLSETYKLVSSSHAMLGVHGAAMTHLLFLRPGSVVVQVVPIGVEWVAEACFGKPAKDMGLEYMEYKIGVEESSLLEKYGKDDLVIKDPMAVQKKGWSTEIMDIYLKEQNVKLDMVRFKRYLKKAYGKAKGFMEKES